MSNKAILAGALAVGIAGVGLSLLSLDRGPDRVPHTHGSAHGQGEAAKGSGVHAAHAGHDHDRMVSVPAGPDAPTLEIEIAPDPETGWNLRIYVSNFRFAPEHASTEHHRGEGHAHVYVNGNKLARVYGSWFHIAELPQGANEIMVTLNTNDHAVLAVDDKPVRAMAMVEAPR